MKFRHSLSIVLTLLLFDACKSSTTIIENEVGIIRGNVQLYENCQPLPNSSGATVAIQGTGFSATSDTSGNWLISNVPAGIYNILITKPGFDTDLIVQDQFSGAGTQFLENHSIHKLTLLNDSVQIVAVTVSEKDSLGPQHMVFPDSILVRDTDGYEYTLNITFTMQGIDSAIAFEAQLKDLTRPNAEFYNGTFPSRGISKNETIASTFSWITPVRYNNQYTAQPGDTLLVTTFPTPSCYGRKVITQSKSFVLPK